MVFELADVVTTLGEGELMSLGLTPEDGRELVSRASLLGTNPVGLPKMKVPKEYPRSTRAGRVGCPTGGLEYLLGQNC